jgi:hypothetical protein
VTAAVGEQRPSALPRRSASGWLVITTTLAASGIVFWSAFTTVQALVGAADVLTIAQMLERRTENSPEVDRDLIEKIGRDNDVAELASSCVGVVAKAVLTYRIARLDQIGAETQLKDERLADVERAAIDVLRCQPLDGNAWLILARIADLQGKPTEDVDRLLRRSFWLAPAEGWIIRKRFLALAPRIEAERTTLASEFALDAMRIVRHLPIRDVSELYVAQGPKVREIMAREIFRLRDRRRDPIIRTVDQLGVTVRKPIEP